MSEILIAQFIAATGSSRAQAIHFLAENENDVGKASLAFFESTLADNDVSSNKRNEYYAGGSKSGVAVIAPGMDGEEIKPAPKPAPPPPSFTGAARTLAGVAAPAPAQAPSGPFQAKRSDYAVPGQPKTRIRFELPNGQQLMLSVNLSATVGDLRSYIVENYPEAAGQPMSLNVQIPPKALENDEETVESAALKMTTIKCTL